MDICCLKSELQAYRFPQGMKLALELWEMPLFHRVILAFKATAGDGTTVSWWHGLCDLPPRVQPSLDTWDLCFVPLCIAKGLSVGGTSPLTTAPAQSTAGSCSQPLGQGAGWTVAVLHVPETVQGHGQHSVNLSILRLL